MDDAGVLDDLVDEIVAKIDAVKAGVSEIVVNRSLFLKSTFFVVELKQIPLRQCPGSVLLGILDDVSRLRSLVDQCCCSKSRVFQVYRSLDTGEKIRDVMNDLSSLLDRCMGIEDKEIVLELRNKIRQTSFSPDQGNAELAAGLREAISGDSSSQGGGIQDTVLENLSRSLAASIPSLKNELLEDKKAAEEGGCLEELAAIEKLLGLLDVAEAPPIETDALELDGFVLDAIPSSFFCPITGQVMREPVLVEGGVTYEKSAIMEWISRGKTRCPVTNADLTNADLVPNRSIENAIRQYVERLNIDKMTRSIKKIKADDDDLDETLEAIRSLTDLDACFKRHVVALDGLAPLVGILKKSTADQRVKILRILISIGEAGDDCKIRIIEAGAVPVVLRILTKCHGDNPDAVSLLRVISEVEKGKEAILAEPGSIIIIVSAVTLDSAEQKSIAMNLLENLCSNTPWVAIEAASSGIFDPLISNLGSGNEAVKLEMADAIATKLELNDASSEALVSAGILSPLVEMLKSGSVRSRVAATKSLHKLSSTGANRSAFANAGAIPLLAGPAAAETIEDRELNSYALSTLANLVTRQECVAALASNIDVSRFLEMIKNNDQNVQDSVLRIIHALARDSKAFRLELRQRDETISYFLTLFSREISRTRTSALGIVFQIAADRDTRDSIPFGSSVNLLGLLEQASASNDDKELALGILSGITKNGPEYRRELAARNQFGLFVSYLQSGTPRMREDAAAVLTRLTGSNLDESTDQELARLDIVRILREILQNGTERGREHASAILANLSDRTPLLTEKQSFLKRLLARLGLKQYRLCAVHLGKCNARTSFCMAEAGVIPLLIAEVRSSNLRNAERGIEALLTLVQGETFRLQGVDFLVKNDVIAPVVSLVGRSSSLTEKAMVLLERIFKCRKYRDEKYSKIAKSSLSTTMTSGSIQARKSAARALMHLGMMSKGSTYTTTTTTEPARK